MVPPLTLKTFSDQLAKFWVLAISYFTHNYLFREASLEHRHVEKYDFAVDRITALLEQADIEGHDFWGIAADIILEEGHLDVDYAYFSLRYPEWYEWFLTLNRGQESRLSDLFKAIKSDWFLFSSAFVSLHFNFHHRVKLQSALEGQRSRLRKISDEAWLYELSRHLRRAYIEFARQFFKDNLLADLCQMDWGKDFIRRASTIDAHLLLKTSEEIDRRSVVETLLTELFEDRTLFDLAANEVRIFVPTQKKELFDRSLKEAKKHLLHELPLRFSDRLAENSAEFGKL